MTQEQADKVFQSDLGCQLDVIYVTSDDKAFIRYEEALKHTKGELDNTLPLTDNSIIEFYPGIEEF